MLDDSKLLPYFLFLGLNVLNSVDQIINFIPSCPLQVAFVLSLYGTCGTQLQDACQPFKRVTGIANSLRGDREPVKWRLGAACHPFKR